MTDNEYKQLENLLGKLRSDLKGYRYCIIPDFFGETMHIGIYDQKGNLTKQEVGYDIKGAVAKINNP